MQAIDHRHSADRLLLQPGITCTRKTSRPHKKITCRCEARSQYDQHLTQAACSRRQLLHHLFAAGVASQLARCTPAEASKLPKAFDQAWTSIGGGQADLFFPGSFLGLWNVQATLMKVDTPLGPDFVPDLRVVERAKREDLQQTINYQVQWVENERGQIIIDRAFNTQKLMSFYMDREINQNDIEWSPLDPNSLKLRLPGGNSVFTRVTKRSEAKPAADRIDTSEYFQQVFQQGGKPEPKVKASQCFTKYKFRSDVQAAGGAAIVATQVISDYLTAYDGEMLLMRSQNKPVVIYTYRMQFSKALPSDALSI